jgi:hypothetical protein
VVGKNISPRGHLKVKLASYCRRDRLHRRAASNPVLLFLSRCCNRDLPDGSSRNAVSYALMPE